MSLIISRPTMLDSFALLSGQLSNINRLLKSDKMPDLRNQIVLPLLLVPEKDDHLEVSIISNICTATCLRSTTY